MRKAGALLTVVGRLGEVLRPVLRRAALVVGLAAASFSMTVGIASADTTIGNLLSTAPVKGYCGEGTFFAPELAAPAILKAPFDGAVVRWRIDLWEPGGNHPYRLRVMKPPKNPGGKYQFTASGPKQLAPADGLNVLDLPQPVPIEAGEIIAFDCDQGAPTASHSPKEAGTTYGYFEKIPADGESVQAVNTAASDEVLINADVVAKPVLSAASPARVGARGGGTLTVSGEHLGGLTAATVGGATGAVTSASETEAKLTVPAHPPGKVDLQVSNSAVASDILAGAVEYVGPPEISGLAQKRKKWKPKVGTSFSFGLTEAGTAKLTFTQGRRGGSRCSPKLRKHHLCGIHTKGSITVTATAGANRVNFKGKLPGGKKLKAGVYEVTLVATNAFGEASSAKPLSFKILP